MCQSVCWKAVAKGKLHFWEKFFQAEVLFRTLEIELLDKDDKQKSLAAVSSDFCTCPPFLPFLFLEEEKSMGLQF